jgi:hypothetical protein
MEFVEFGLWLTSFGWPWLAGREEFMPESHRFHLQYDHLRKILIRGPSDTMSAEAPPEPGPELGEVDFTDYG